MERRELTREVCGLMMAEAMRDVEERCGGEQRRDEEVRE
jgi:hypothetical protein